MKKRFNILVSVIAIALLSLMFVSPKGTTGFGDLNVDALAEGESVGPCYSGGEGSEECSIAPNVDLGDRGRSGGCSSRCGSAYYACCDVTCYCIPVLSF